MKEILDLVESFPYTEDSEGYQLIYKGSLIRALKSKFNSKTTFSVRVRPNASINIEFLAGTTIEEAIDEASAIALELNLAYCCFSFNGVKCSISQNPNRSFLIKDYARACKSQGYLIG